MAKLIYSDLTYQIIGAAMEAHRILGPGFLESVYQSALDHELELQDIQFEREKPLTVNYKKRVIGEYRADFVVEEKAILELKAVSALHDKHKAQAIHYLKATGYKLAILLNFGTPSLEYKRIIN